MPLSESGSNDLALTLLTDLAKKSDILARGFSKALPTQEIAGFHGDGTAIAKVFLNHESADC